MQAKANQRQAENVIAANEVQPDTGSDSAQSKPASAAEQLLQQVQSLSPVQYLQALRQEKGGFVTDNELKSLEDIAQLKRLPNEVINVMLYELTVVEQKTSLNRNLMQTIVNDWSQAGVKTAKDAFSYLQKRQQQKQQTPATPKRRYQNQRPVKNETRPDWEEQRAKAAANSNQQADAQRKLDALLKANQAKQEDQPQ
nr:DnaD domain protein [Weissella uvarum]